MNITKQPNSVYYLVGDCPQAFITIEVTGLPYHKDRQAIIDYIVCSVNKNKTTLAEFKQLEERMK